MSAAMFAGQRVVSSVPSLKSLEAAFPMRGKALRAALTANTSLMQRLQDANEIIGGHGVEHLPTRPAVTYVNMGDPYSTTILAVYSGRVSGWFSIRIGAWGDGVERGTYREVRR